MEWDKKFHTILKETERNLAKAKGKLSPSFSNLTAADSPKKKISGHSKVRPRIFLEKREDKALCNPLSSSNMNDSSSMQVLHLQEQIASQNRMIEKLQRLVKSLDSEREYYKEQMSSLKGDIDVLNNTVNNQTSMLNSELKAARVKNEVMHEINKVKAMVHNHDRDSSKRSNLLSPRFDAEFWNIKENLTDNLEEVRFELSQMNRRIDQMEDRLAVSHSSTLKSDRLPKSLLETDHLPSRPLFTPTNGVVLPSYHSDLHLIRLNMSTLTEKLDNLERKSFLQLPVPTAPTDTSTHYFKPSDYKSFIDSDIPKYSPRISSTYVFDDEGSYDVHSVSDLSDLSNLSGDGKFDDLDLNLMTLDLKEDDMDFPLPPNFNSPMSKRKKKRGKVEFEIDDLELSDIDYDEDLSLESDNLNFNT